MQREVTVDGEVRRIAFDRCVNAGYSGRDEEAVQAHIDELAEEGIDPPERVPMFYEVSPYTVLVDPDVIRTVGDRTSGEAEFGLFVTGEETYVVAASDQTDRELETRSVHLSKQIAPNVVSGAAWRLSTIRDRWDDVEIRAWNTVDGERTLYQDTTLASVLEPEDLLDHVEERFDGPRHGTVVLSGTVPTVAGELEPGERFEVELRDPGTDRTLSVDYGVETM